MPTRSGYRPAPKLSTRSGTPGLRPDGTVPEDFTEEAIQAWRNIEDALGRAGAALTDVVSVRQWLINASSVIKHEPVLMFAVVPALVWPEIRVEVEVIAIRPGT
jgi:2-iminobutanoate/2-iminopropanoate deaminase